MDDLIKKYQELGINLTEQFAKLKKVRMSLHCWQLDDVAGFEKQDISLSGGIQTTGNYPYKARNFEELKMDLTESLKLIPGAKNINIHASYQTDDIVERDKISPKNYKKWIDFAKENNVGLDFNPTLFSSDKVFNNRTLSSPNLEIRKYWIEHCKRSREITEYFGKELGMTSLCNIWIPDGLKDVPGSRIAPRQLLKESLDEIYSEKLDEKYIADAVESKVFGIGVESYTVGSHEFYMGYALKNDKYCLLDTGHFHLTENVADKISSLLLFSPKLAFHVSRPVRWDSDHVLRLNDELQDVADALVDADALDKIYLGLDYFDASINRVFALTMGARNMQKALLKALTTPFAKMRELQENCKMTELFALQEKCKLLPFGEVWDAYLEYCGVLNDEAWYQEIVRYENEVLKRRG